MEQKQPGNTSAMLRHGSMAEVHFAGAQVKEAGMYGVRADLPKSMEASEATN